MGKTLEQVESFEDLQLLMRGDRVKLIDVDFRGKKSPTYEVAVHIDQRGDMCFLMPHPNDSKNTIRRYYSRPSKITFDEQEKAFCVHETHTAITNHDYSEPGELAKRVGMLSKPETLRMAGF